MLVYTYISNVICNLIANGFSSCTPNYCANLSANVAHSIIHRRGPETRDPTTLSSLQYMSLAVKEASMYIPNVHSNYLVLSGLNKYTHMHTTTKEVATVRISRHCVDLGWVESCLWFMWQKARSGFILAQWEGVDNEEIDPKRSGAMIQLYSLLNMVFATGRRSVQWYTAKREVVAC